MRRFLAACLLLLLTGCGTSLDPLRPSLLLTSHFIVDGRWSSLANWPRSF